MKTVSAACRCLRFRLPGRNVRSSGARRYADYRWRHRIRPTADYVTGAWRPAALRKGAATVVIDPRHAPGRTRHRGMRSIGRNILCITRPGRGICRGRRRDRAASAGTFYFPLQRATVAANGAGTKSRCLRRYTYWDRPSRRPKGSPRRDGPRDDGTRDCANRMCTKRKAFTPTVRHTFRSLCQLRGAQCTWGVKGHCSTRRVFLQKRRLEQKGSRPHRPWDIPGRGSNWTGAMSTRMRGSHAATDESAHRSSCGRDWQDPLVLCALSPRSQAVALILALIGFYGSVLANSAIRSRPFQGWAGCGIALLVAAYAFHLLPVQFSRASALIIARRLHELRRSSCPPTAPLGIGPQIAFAAGCPDVDRTPPPAVSPSLGPLIAIPGRRNAGLSVAVVRMRCAAPACARL
jgi:hypothetical protein